MRGCGDSLCEREGRSRWTASILRWRWSIIGTKIWSKFDFWIKKKKKEIKISKRLGQNFNPNLITESFETWPRFHDFSSENRNEGKDDLCRAGTIEEARSFFLRVPLFEEHRQGWRGRGKKRDYRVHNGEGPSLKLFWRRYACVHAILSFLLSFLPSSVLLSLFPLLPLTRCFEHRDLCMRNYTRGLRKNRNSMWWPGSKRSSCYTI